jgi:hypothetical protein
MTDANLKEIKEKVEDFMDKFSELRWNLSSEMEGLDRSLKILEYLLDKEGDKEPNRCCGRK